MQESSQTQVQQSKLLRQLDPSAHVPGSRSETETMNLLLLHISYSMVPKCRQSDYFLSGPSKEASDSSNPGVVVGGRGITCTGLDLVRQRISKATLFIKDFFFHLMQVLLYVLPLESEYQE